MNETGIGYAGIEGAWWLPAAESFVLPRHVYHNLVRIGRAVFALFDAVTGLYGTSDGAACGLNHLLDHKVPASIPRLISAARVLSVRPDFQLQRLRDGSYRLVATELEICPSAHGFAHAMQVGYGLRPDLVESFARFLNGRELLFVSTSEWSEFLFEQLAFCSALNEVGARGRVLLDAPITTIAERVKRRELWRPPMFGVREMPPVWRDDVLSRIHQHRFEPFLRPNDADWPDEVGGSVVFRFGYFDCFSTDKLRRMARWEANGATFLNPTSFILDSKAILAALQLRAVRRRIAADDLAVLDRYIPETRLLEPDLLPQLQRERHEWVLKYAGYDRGNRAWGGRSLQIGAQHTSGSWADLLRQYAELPWPVVAQRIAPTMKIDIAYRDVDDDVRWLHGGTRLRSFFVRTGDKVTACGSHLTVSGGAMQVSESMDAVQAPVVFQD
jgi:hypothetical protein